MQNNIQLNLKHSNILEQNVMQYADKVASIHDELHEKSNDEKEFLGWLELPSNYNKKEF